MKKIFVTVLAFSLSSLTISAFAAHELIINNKTNKDSTAKINGTCSTLIGEKGITRAHSTNHIDATTVWTACIRDLHNCKAEVYMDAHCGSGDKDKVALVNFDTDKGIKEVTYYSGEYKIFGNGFEITLEGGK